MVRFERAGDRINAKERKKCRPDAFEQKLVLDGINYLQMAGVKINKSLLK